MHKKYTEAEKERKEWWRGAMNITLYDEDEQMTMLMKSSDDLSAKLCRQHTVALKADGSHLGLLVGCSGS